MTTKPKIEAPKLDAFEKDVLESFERGALQSVGTTSSFAKFRAAAKSTSTKESLLVPALLIIDMQLGMSWPTSGIRNNPQAESVIGNLLNLWRANGFPVVHVRHISRTPGSVFWPGQSGVEFQPELTPLPYEHIVEKNVPDAFANTGLERWLHARGYSSLVIVGVSTNNSVEATARSAGNLRFRTYVVSDGTFAFERTDLRGHKWSAEDVHAMALSNLHGEYATVISSQEASIFTLAGVPK